MTTLGGLAGYLLPETTGGTTAAGVTAVDTADTTATAPVTDGVRPLVYDTGQQPLYRGSTTPPGVVSQRGFPSKGSDPDIVAHLADSTPYSAYRSASRSFTVAGWYAISNLNGRGWCYLICKSGGVDVNATLAGSRWLPAFAHDQEVAFPGAIEPQSITGGWRVTEDPMGNPVFGEFVPNPGFDPALSPIQLPTDLLTPWPDGTISEAVPPAPRSMLQAFSVTLTACSQPTASPTSRMLPSAVAGERVAFAFTVVDGRVAAIELRADPDELSRLKVASLP